ncbi:hypothetical protein SDC49_04660 [Lactobacillus sp. R2/2]|nr:hypothetical protein [Lactobacillus sp. R2/2]
MNEPNSIVIINKIKRLVGFNQRSLSAVVKIYTANKTVKLVPLKTCRPMHLDQLIGIALARRLPEVYIATQKSVTRK